MIIDIVGRGHAFPLTTDDTATISRVYEAFRDFIGTTAMGFASVSASMRHTIDSFHQGQIARYLDIVQMSSR